MTDVFKYILVSTTVFILFSLPSVLFDSWLLKIGVLRYSSRIIILIASFVFVFAKPLLRGDVSWWTYGIIYILGVLALYRSDFGETMKHGKWWWKPKEKKKPLSSR